MPYNISRKVCERQKSILEQMADERRDITIQTRTPQKKAYQIREALEAVQHHEDYKALYGSLQAQYRVRTRKGAVDLIWMLPRGNGPKLSTEVTQSEMNAILPHPVQPAIPPQSMQIEGIGEMLQVIGAAIKLKAETDEIYFPDANLADEDKLTLYNWAKEVGGWKYIDHEGAGLTLTRRLVDDFILWEPPTENTSNEEEENETE